MNSILILTLVLIAACSCCRAQDDGPQPVAENPPLPEATLAEVTQGIEKLGAESDELAARMKALAVEIAATSSALFGSRPADPEKRIGLRDRYVEQLRTLTTLDKDSAEWKAASVIAEATRKQVDDMQAAIDRNTVEYKALRARATTARLELAKLLDRLEVLSKQPPVAP